MRRKEIGAIFAGIGFNIIFVIVQITVKTMPLAASIFGYFIGTVLIIIGVVFLFVKPKGTDTRMIFARNMQTLANEISQFLSERKRYDPSHTPHWYNPRWDSWDEERRREEFQKYSQNIVDYLSQTMSLYQERFAGKVIHLIEEAIRLDYHDEELERFYKHPTNTIGLEIVANRLSALAERIGLSTNR